MPAALHGWYHAISQLDPGRVCWQLPPSGLHGRNALDRRHGRTGTSTFDAVITQLPAG
jgi:hypothetical protein